MPNCVMCHEEHGKRLVGVHICPDCVDNYRNCGVVEACVCCGVMEHKDYLRYKFCGGCHDKTQRLLAAGHTPRQIATGANRRVNALIELACTFVLRDLKVAITAPPKQPVATPPAVLDSMRDVLRTGRKYKTLD